MVPRNGEASKISEAGCGDSGQDDALGVGRRRTVEEEGAFESGLWDLRHFSGILGQCPGSF